MARPVLSVIICTYNPDAGRMGWTLEGLATQTLDPTRYEVVVVDNGSTPPVEIADRQGLNLRIIRESRNGLSFARSRGIEEACAPLIVFVDDDNRLDADYLEQALAIATASPDLGAFGGRSVGVFSRPPRPWELRVLGAVGIRDGGPAPITAAKEDWGIWLPIGAGLVCRQAVGLRYKELVSSDSLARSLGRSSSSWLSGDDTLLARTAVQCGYSCAYRPELRLKHFISTSRLRLITLARTMYGHGRAHAILEHLRDGADPINPLVRLTSLGINLVRRIWAGGIRSGLLHWIWDYGNAREYLRLRAHRSHSTPAARRFGGGH